MLELNCPFCGPRPEVEFRCGGEAAVRRPDDPASCGDREWSDYLWNRSNPRGRHVERWCHAHGCGRWFRVVRDTVSDRILEVRAIGEAVAGEAEGKGD